MNTSSMNTSAMKKILVIGSTVADIIIELDRLPVTAEDVHVKTQSMSLGGCAHNVAVMACLSMGLSLSEALAAANAVSAKIVSVKGALLRQEEFRQALDHLSFYPRFGL